jgi:hypothetical protein
MVPLAKRFEGRLLLSVDAYPERSEVVGHAPTLDEATRLLQSAIAARGLQAGYILDLRATGTMRRVYPVYGKGGAR